MKKAILKAVIAAFVLTVVLAAVSCSSANDFDKNDVDTWFDGTGGSKISVNETEKIEEGMTFTEVVGLIGKPKRDVGSGVLIAEWDLRSGGAFDVSFRPVNTYVDDVDDIGDVWVVYSTHINSDKK